MFYSQHVLTKKGPLAKIWLAAHMQTKLTKAMVFSTDIRNAVDSILQPPIPMALRLTSNLLLGIVRILHRKSKYLLQESSDAMTKLKLTFRPHAADATTKAPFNSITLNPQTVDALQAPNLDLDLLPQRKQVPRAAFLAQDRDITIDEFAGGLAGGMLDAFALEPEMVRDADLADAEPLLFTPSRMTQRNNLGTPISTGSGKSVEVLRAGEAEERDPVLSGAKDGETTPAPQEPVEAPEDDFSEPPVPMGGLTPDRTPSRPSGGERSLGANTPLEIGAGRISGDQLMIADDETVDVAKQLVVTQEGEDGVPATQEGTQTQDGAQTQDDMEIDVTQTQDATQTQTQTQEADSQQPIEPIEDVEAADVAPNPPRRRKRKATVLMDYDATELSATAFRACLMDTSDLIRQPTQRRRIHAPAVRYEEALALPTRQFAPELRALFADCFRMNDIVVASPISDAELEERGKQDEAEGGQEEEAEKAREGDELEEETPDGEAVGEGGEEMVLKVPEADLPIPDAELPAMQEMEDDRRDTLTPVAPPPEDDAFDMPPSIEAPSLDRATDSQHEHSESVVIASQAEQLDHGTGKDSLLREVADTAAQVDGADVDYVTEATVSARTRKMQDVIVNHLVDEEFGFSSLVREDNRRTAARCFYELLNLSGKKAVQLRQDGAYGDIFVKPIQPTFDSIRGEG